MNQEKNSPASTAVNTPRKSDSPGPLEFLFVVGGNVLNRPLDFLGVVAEVEPALLGYQTFPEYPSHPLPPIANSILELAFETRQIEVIKLEAIHAVNRYLVTDDDENIFGGKFFCFTVHPNSVVKNSEFNFFFSYCFHTVEVVPLSHPWEGYAGILPVVYSIVSPSSAIADYEDHLRLFAKNRRNYMRQFWAGKTLFDYAFTTKTALHIVPPSRFDDQQLIDSTIPFLLSMISPSVIVGAVAAAILDKRLIVVSFDRIKRSNFVLALFVFMDKICQLKYPHPCLGIVPVAIASELANAPTPLIAAVSRTDKSSRKKKSQDCIFLDLDKGCDDPTLTSLGESVFPPQTEEGPLNKSTDLEKISSRIVDRLKSHVSEICRLTESCSDFSSAVAVVSQQQSSMLTSFFNSSTFQLYLSETGCASWLDHNH
jgi:hypothetical protein